MRIFTLCLIVLMVGACSSSGKKSSEKLYYRFPAVASASIDKNIIVKRPTAMGILGSRPMVVKTVGGALKQMNNNFWLDSPKILLQNYLVNLLPPQSQAESFVLNSQILMLEKKHEITILQIKFVLTDLKGKEVLNKTYTQERNQDNNSVPLFVKAIGSMLKETTLTMIEDIR